MHTCPNCSAQFNNRNDCSKHSKKCLKGIETFTYNSQEITVYKNADAGGKAYKTLEVMKRHLKSTKSHWVGKNQQGDTFLEASQDISVHNTQRVHQQQHSVSMRERDDPIEVHMEETQPLHISRTISMDQEIDINESISKASRTESSIDLQDDQPQASEIATRAISQESQDGLLHHPYLDTINIVVNPDLRILCCHICQVALAPGHVSGHMRNVHPAIKLHDDRFCQAVADIDIATALPTSIAGGRGVSAYKGLKTHNGFACDLCSYAGGSRVTMGDHHREKHQSIPLPKQWTPCMVQQLDRGVHKKYWRVAGGQETSCDHQDAIDKMRKEMEEVTRVEQVPQEKRLVSPWLLTTRWHEHVAGHEVATLRKLVEIPKADEAIMPDLAHAVELYFESALVLLDTTEELVLQRLNSPDPLKERVTSLSYAGINNSPLHRHQEAGTMKSYVRSTIGLLAMLLRTDRGDDYEIPIPQHLMQALQELELALTEKEETTEKIHAVLTMIWMTKWVKEKDNTIPCPTERFLALHTLEADGRHREPVLITPILARLEYCMRLACLKQLKILSTKLYDGNDEAACDALQPWFTDKTNSPFSGLRSLQHRASSIAYKTTSLPRVWWVDRKRWMEMLYRGDKVHINQLREMFASLEMKLVDLWENKVLVGIRVYVHYKNLVDDSNNYDVGYCFLSDRRNTCFADRDRFLKALIDNPEVFSQFAVTRSQRNLVILGKNLTMLRTYHKGSALSGTDKLIPHSIDGVTADIMIQDLALTRPFAEVAAHICYPDKPWIKESYQKHIFMNDHKLFTSEQLSATMARESHRLQRKLGRFAEELLEEDDQDTIEALQAGHSRTTENRIYGLSPDTLAAGAEDLLPQFLQASTNWQLLMHTVPGGLELAYTDARTHHFKQLADSGRFGSDYEEIEAPSHVRPPLIDAPKVTAEIHLSTDTLANRIAGKLEEKMMAGIEQRLVTRVVDALTPVLERIVMEAMKTAIPQQLVGVPTNDITSTISTAYAYAKRPLQQPKPQVASHPFIRIGRDNRASNKEWDESDADGQTTSSDYPTTSNESNMIDTTSEDDVIGQKLKEVEIVSDDYGASAPPANQLALKDKERNIERKCLAKGRQVMATLKRETDVIATAQDGRGKVDAGPPSGHNGGRQGGGGGPSSKVLDDRLGEKAQSHGSSPSKSTTTSRPLSTSINLILCRQTRPGSRHGDKCLAEFNEILPKISECPCRMCTSSDSFPMQLVLLSGTIPPSSLASLKAMFGLLPTAIEDKRVQQPSRAGTRWPFYNGSKDVSDASRAQYYKDWRSGKSPVMICTSAFSTGNDYPHVRLVIHLKTPLEMSEIIQAQGRGGRDGNPARCYMLPSTSPPKIIIGRSETDHKGLWYAHDHIYSHGLKRCLRYGSTLYIDGEGTKCGADRRNQLCCVCKNDAKEPVQAKAATQQHVRMLPTSPLHRRAVSTNIPPLQQRTRMLIGASPSHGRKVSLNKRVFNDMSGAADPFAEAATRSKKLKTTKQAAEMSQVDRMRKALDTMKDKGCTLCYASDNGELEDHRMSQCPSWTSIDSTLGQYFEWKKEIRYNNHKGICWICHVPTCRDELHVPLVKGFERQPVRTGQTL
ncbi:hypothetical protein DEU56DRAFT_985445 [Suillus clintonianus]|uniref:uncharacterized protein n=1 Tax=Suillus clintonianus TaxID=1904413 RepID=UPI001B8772AE|nr:uncharacterized protein DEU56DRAFT_985445 [Suillus clintonianus]KAG2110016.1 hypothetical protein DEU56DRAFT_985445 [Suillus clintonianus]